MTLAEAIRDFLLHCQYGKNLSPKTLSAYSTDLRQFREYLESHSEDEATDITTIAKSTLRAYIKSLFLSNAEKTIKRKVATLKAFFHHLEREDFIGVNPFRKMEVRIKETRRLPRTIDLPELELLFKYLYDLKNLHNDKKSYAYRALVRDIAVVELLFATGARVSEVCNLRTEDIDLRRGCVRILGKGARERMIQICDEEIMAALRDHHCLWGLEGQQGYLFQNRSGGRLSDQSIRQILKNGASRAGMKSRLTPHMLRHSVATLLLEEDVDIRHIQVLLGHSSISTTQIYTDISSSQQRKVLAAKHPRRRIKPVKLVQ